MKPWGFWTYCGFGPYGYATYTTVPGGKPPRSGSVTCTFYPKATTKNRQLSHMPSPIAFTC